MNQLLETLLEESFTAITESHHNTPRQLSFPTAEDMIKVAVGMRRTGKTHFLYQTIRTLLEQGISKEQILPINFEDDRLLPMDAKQMGAFLDEFYALYPENHNRRCYFFLDEVQNVTDWHLVIRRFFDKKNVQIYLTGSSAKLLSKEINTRLRGRSLAVEVLPYSFDEYLITHKVSLPQKPFGQAALDKMRSHLLQYFSTGGFPGVQHMPDDEWRQTLQGYVDTVILRDIVERHNVNNIALLKYLIMSLLKSTGASFAVNKFYNDIKSQGFKVNKDTIYNYLDYIQDAFLIFTVPHYAESARARQNIPKKIYAIDNGLINATSFSLHPNYGKLLENLIYLDLRRQHKTVYFYRTQDDYEIDFVTVDSKNQRELIQVCWDINDKETLAREQRALKKAEEELGIKGKLITARDYLKTFTQ